MIGLVVRLSIPMGRIIGIILGICAIGFLISLYRTQYGAQSGWLGGQALSSPLTNAYYSDLRASLQDELTQLGFQQVSALPNEFGFQMGLRPGDTIWKAPQDHFYAVLSPDIYAGTIEGTKTTGFYLQYDYFEHCWQPQAGRLSHDEEKYHVALQKWYREYAIIHPVTFYQDATCGF
jgi:hypothetical protein